jgi:hypothetical protein
MAMEFVPLLQIQRDLLNIPRGMERFRAYLATIVNDSGDDVDLVPLVVMNPMSREHVAECQETLLAVGAEEVGAQAVADFEARCPFIQSNHKVGIVVVDDIAGGWTNRPSVEAWARIGALPKHDRGWVGIGWWVSEPSDRQRLYEQTLAALYRHFYKVRYGTPVTVRQGIRQEGFAAKFAGIHPTLEPDDLAYSQEILMPYLDNDHFPTVIACLLGDNAATTMGYPPIGLSPNAGIEVGIMEAWAEDTTAPENLLNR